MICFKFDSPGIRSTRKKGFPKALLPRVLFVLLKLLFLRVSSWKLRSPTPFPNPQPLPGLISSGPSWWRFIALKLYRVYKFNPAESTWDQPPRRHFSRPIRLCPRAQRPIKLSLEQRYKAPSKPPLFANLFLSRFFLLIQPLPQAGGVLKLRN